MKAKNKLEASLLVQALSISELRAHMTRKAGPVLAVAATVLGLGLPVAAQAQSFNSTNVACQVAGAALGGWAGYAAGGNNSAAQRALGVAGGAAGTIGAKALCEMFTGDAQKPQTGGYNTQQRPSPAVERGMRNSSGGGQQLSYTDSQGMERLARAATSTMEQWMDAEQYAATTAHNGNPSMAAKASESAADARERFVFEAQNFQQTMGEVSRQYDTSRFRSINTMVGHMANVAQSGNYRTYEDLRVAMQTARNSQTAKATRVSYPSPRF